MRTLHPAGVDRESLCFQDWIWWLFSPVGTMQRTNRTRKSSPAISCQQCSEWMVDQTPSKTLLALWNGEKNDGTWNCIKYARSLKRMTGRKITIHSCWHGFFLYMCP